ncbi:MAG TPA: hypothetical protein DEF07_07560 [Nitrosomonas sp.]|nr:hypothetical protein [Nitrosomonas sp.]
MSSKLTQSSEGYHVHINLEGTKLDERIREGTNQKVLQDIAVAIFSATKPCKAYFYRVRTRYGENPTYLIDRCASRLNTQMTHVIRYFKALENLEKNEYQRSRELLLQVLEERNDFFLGLVELSYVSLQLYFNHELDKNVVIQTLKNTETKISGHPQEHYLNGSLYVLLGETKKAIREYKKHLNKNKSDQHVKSILGSLDDKNGISFLRENANLGDPDDQMILGTLLFNSKDKDDENEGIYWLIQAAKSGSVLPVLVLMSKADFSNDVSAGDYVKRIRDKLEMAELSNNIYAKFLLSLLNLLESRLLCGREFYGSEFQAVYELFQTQTAKYGDDAMAHLMLGLLHSMPYDNLYDVDIATYHYTAAQRHSRTLKLNDKKIYDALVNLFGLGQEPNVSEGIDVALNIRNSLKQNPFEYSLQKQIMPDSIGLKDEKIFVRFLMNYLALVDAFKLSGSEWCLMSYINDYEIVIDDGTHTPRELIIAKNHRENLNFAGAFALFMALAWQNENEAQYFLALMYSNGHGVAQNCTKAHYWLTAAIEDGSEKAKHTKLGKCPAP